MSGKRVARHAQSRNRKRGLIMAGVLAAVVAVAAVVALDWLPGTGGDDTAETASSPSSSSASPSVDATKSGSSEAPSSSPSPKATASAKVRPAKQLRACADSVRTVERAVKAADSGVGNWSSHIRARTDMLEGRMSMEKMDAVWTRTQAAGPGDQKRFDTALRDSSQSSSCAGLQDTSGPRKVVAQRCGQRARAATRALDSAKAAMKDWRVHLSNMQKYSNDQMSAAMAQDKWVKAWRKAPKNISAYRDATAALAKAPPCPGAAS